MKVIHTESAKVPGQLEALLPTGTALPSLTVIVFRTSLGLHLRRELVLRAPHAGIRFVSPEDAAQALLYRKGVDRRETSFRVRALALEILLRTGTKESDLEYFNLSEVSAASGYAEAFSATMGRLAEEGLSASDLREIAAEEKPVFSSRLRDLAFLWEELDKKNLPSGAQVLREATRILEENPEFFPWPGKVAAVLDEPVTSAQARFLSVIPGLELFHCPALPERPEYRDRLAHLSGILGQELTTVRPESKADQELDLLRSYLFERPQVLSEKERARSKGPDGSVHLEITSGMEDEIERACDWVAGQISKGIPIRNIAVLVPNSDRLLGILYSRLGRLSWGEAGLPVFVAGGLPATDTPAGYRIAKLLDALLGHMAADALVDLAPFLRVEDEGGERRRVSRARAIEILYGAGTLGGSPAHPETYREWLPSLRGKLQALQARVTRIMESGETGKGSRGLNRLKRDIRDISSILPALESLSMLSDAMENNRPLGEIRTAIEILVKERIILPPEGAKIVSGLQEKFAGLGEGWLSTGLSGRAAVEAVRRELGALQVPVGKYGEPKLYLGTINSAQGLSFDSVRIIGLAEGEFPGVPSEDPILPEMDRIEIEKRFFKGAHALPGGQDRATSSLHALWRLLRGVSGQVVLSAPRESLDRQAREPSGVLLEVAAALWRHDETTGPVPGSGSFHTHYIRKGKTARPSFQTLLGSQDGFAAVYVARSEGVSVPSGWFAEQDRIRKLKLGATAKAGGVEDGFLSPGAILPSEPGLRADHPISASRLQRLLECPHHFLFQDLLNWPEPGTPPTGIDIDPFSYGTLLHDVQEEFLNRFGKDFVAREKDIDSWISEAVKIARELFNTFLFEYPLIGSAVQARYRRRLEYDIRNVLGSEWSNHPEPAEFGQAERSIGYPDPIALPTKPPLHVHGFIDRVDQDKNGTIVRDLKSGKAHPRIGEEEDPLAPLDVQLAVYALALDNDPTYQGPKVKEVLYAYAKGIGNRERVFLGDYPQFLTTAKKWLSLSGQLLAAHAFPRTTNPEDCKWCPFQGVCGPEAQVRAYSVLEDKKDLLGSFLALKEGAE